MVEIEVRIKGPGGVISVEAAIIRYALEAFGVTVTCNDLYSLGLPELDESFCGRATHVTLTVDHVPWGG